jgi:flagellar biosynthesis/type III secretory pathway protein FliH
LYLNVTIALPIASPKILKLNSIPVQTNPAGKSKGQSTVIRPISAESTSTSVMGQDGIEEGTSEGKSEGCSDGSKGGSTLGFEDGSEDGIKDGRRDGRRDGIEDGSDDGSLLGL